MYKNAVPYFAILLKMKEIAWVFGTSGSGKETFLRNASRYPDLLQNLGWSDLAFSLCEASIEYIGQFKNDPITLQRDKILNEVPVLLEGADVVLIKWQVVDSDAKRPQRLLHQLPNVLHRIIRLYAPEEELIARLQDKPWWHNYGHEAEFIQSETELVRKYIEELGTGFTVTDIKSGATQNYEV